jgi:MFS family permease
MKIRKPTAPGIVLFLLCMMYFLTYIDRVNVGTAASSIQKEFGLSNTQLGLVFSGFAYPYALFQVIGGWIGDRLGPRKTLLICGGIWAVSTCMTGLATGLASLMFFRVALGFGEGATFPTATRAMQSWTPTGRRGFAQGVTHSFARLGNAVTPPIVVALMIWLKSWRGAFLVLGLVSLIWVVVWWLYYRDDPREHSGITAEDLARLPPPSAPKTAAKHVPWGRLTWRILPVTLTYFCYGWSLWLFLNWLPSFFLKGYHLDIKKSALFSSGVFFAGVVGDALGGIASDYLFHKTGNVKFARLTVILTGMLGAAACLIPVIYSRDLNTLALCLTGGFFFLEVVIGPIWSVPMDIAPQYSGTASGLMNTGSAVAAIVSPLVFGYIVDVTGNWQLPFYGSVGLLLIGAVLAFTMHPDRKFVDTPVTDAPLPLRSAG